MQDMADASKAQKLKLANSRKRFKELQELKKKKNQKDVEETHKISNDITPIDSMTSSSHSSVNNEITENVENLTQFANISNTSDNNCEIPASLFFDNFMQKGHNESNYIDFHGENKSGDMSRYFSNLPETNYEDTTPNTVNPPTSVFQHVPDINGVQENYSLFPQDQVNSYEEEKRELMINDDLDEDYQTELDKMQQNSEDLLSKSEGKEDNSECEITGASNRTQLEIQHSNVESLKQLSNQMAELIEPQFCSGSPDYNNSITDLEKRNLELASMLEHEKVKSEKSVILVNELHSRIAYLENLVKEQGDLSNYQSNREISKLKEELQSHVQTIGLLVAEKTELSVSLNKFEICTKQKTSECEELQARLKASRSRVAELEKEVSNFKLQRGEIENSIQENNTFLNSLKHEYQLLKEQKDELLQDLLETREKLKNSSEENLKLHQSHQELANKLSSANIKLQQITSSDRLHMETDLDKITEEKFSLEKQLSDLNLLLKTMTKERDESVLQYQQYAQQQNVQLNNLTKKIEQLQMENENLSLQEQNRIKHISELEKQLQNLQVEQVALATDKTSNDFDSRIDLENARELCVQLQMEKITLEENYTKVSNEKEMLMKELEAKNDSLAQLEGLVEQLQGNQPDSVKLLATMESDKVAAARAVQQNKELKQHVESLEEVFLKLNNDKVELTDQVNREVRNNKDLLHKLQKTEIHLQRLTEAVEIKDRELLDLRQEMVNIQKQLFQKEQVNDRLRHYEVQDNSNHSLQNELKEAKETILRLTNEINILKHRLNEKTSSDIIENIDNPDSFNKLESIQANEDNIKFTDTNIRNQDNLTELTEVSDRHEILDKELAVKYLEEKFKRTMQDIADLQEEKQQLEHLVLQLQGETETIGEYVALYQHQRMILKQRALERDQQLKQLTSDREYLKTKLEKLDNLVRKLVDNKHITEESLSQLDSDNSVVHDETNVDKANSETEVLINNEYQSSGIADNIIELLTEIKSSNLVQPETNVHHCAFCSGQLITV